MPERIDENKLTERKNLTERRFEFQVRSAAAEDGKGEELYVEGYASVFDSPTVLFEYEGREYKENICKGAFDGCQMSDVIFNYNHSGKVMARTRNKTLELNIDDTGLFVRARLDGTEEGRKLYEEIKGGYTVGATTLRDLVLSYGGDEFSGGQGVLFLNKTDLVALGDVRGTNEKKAVYEIIPDANPNTGIIKDGGLAVKYCICSALTACAGTSQSATAKQRTMVYGDPKNFELDLFSAYEVRVSEDFAFTSLMDTIVGDVEVGGKVKVSKGFVALTIAKTP